MRSELTRKKIETPGVAAPGVSLCLLALAVTVKPLADVVGDYTRCDSHKEIGEVFQA